MNWYIIYVRGSYEEKLVDYLNDNGFNAFVPKKAKYFRDHGVTKMVNQLLFPNYIFVESELDNVEFACKLELLKKRKSGFVKQLRHDLQGTSALDASEKAMIERLIGKDKVIESSIGFIENDKVVVTEGPLMGFESHIVYINRHKRIATIEIDIMGEIRNV